MINLILDGLFKQVNITPVLDSFPEAKQQAKFYQQYRISKVHYKVIPLDIVNVTMGGAQM